MYNNIKIRIYKTCHIILFFTVISSPVSTSFLLFLSFVLQHEKLSKKLIMVKLFVKLILTELHDGICHALLFQKLTKIPTVIAVQWPLCSNISKRKGMLLWVVSGKESNDCTRSTGHPVESYVIFLFQGSRGTKNQSWIALYEEVYVKPHVDLISGNSKLNLGSWRVDFRFRNSKSAIQEPKMSSELRATYVTQYGGRHNSW